MRGRATRFEAAALVDGDVDQYRTVAHVADLIGVYQFRCPCPRHENRADHEVRTEDVFPGRRCVCDDRSGATVEPVRQPAQSGHALVENRDVGTQAQGDGSRVGACHPAADDCDTGGSNTRDAAKQHAAAAGGSLQCVGPHLHRHAARDLAHRREQRQAAIVCGDGLVGNGGGTARHQRVAQRGVGGQVEIGKQDLAFFKHRAFIEVRLLDLDHEGLGKGLQRRANASAGRDVIRVAESNAGTGIGLDHDAVPAMGQFRNGRRRESDAVFVDLGLPGNANAHRLSPAPISQLHDSRQLCAQLVCVLAYGIGAYSNYLRQNMVQTVESISIDNRDRIILHAIQQNGRISNADLAERISLSESASLRRLKRLEDAGLIRDYVGLVDQSLAGYPDNVFVQITLASQQREDLAAFEQAIVELPEVMECYLMSGEADYLVRVIVRDARDYERIHSHYLTALPGVDRVHSGFALRTVVKRTELPVR